MAHLHLAKILVDLPNVKKDGAAFVVPEEVECVLFVALGHEVLQVAKVERIEMAEIAVTIFTHKHERFVFPPDQIIGLRVGGENKARLGGAGFR